MKNQAVVEGGQAVDPFEVTPVRTRYGSTRANPATLSDMSTARGSYAKGLVKRDEILDAALSAFAENGYDRTSVREIARRAGLTQAGLLHYFANKEELFLAILRRRDDRSSDPVRSTPTHPVDRLIDAVQTNADEPGLVRLFVSMSAESTEKEGAGHTFFSERYQWLRAEIAKDVRRHQGDGDMASTVDADDVASILVAVTDGLQLQWLLDPQGVDMKRRLALLWEILRNPVERGEVSDAQQ
ncbi:MAG: TetR/AcrR family transcriptional regulator [Leifsonia sp.]